MKKIILALSLLTVLFNAYAQKDLLARAKKEYKNQQLDLAAKSIEEALQDEKHKDKPETMFTRGLIYSEIAMDTANKYPSLSGTALQEALQSFEKVKASGKNIHAANSVFEIEKLYKFYLNRGVIFYQANEFKKSADLFYTASKVMPEDTTALNYFFMTEMGLEDKNNDRLKEAGERLTKLNYHAAYIYQVLAMIANEAEQNPEKALEIARKGRQALPNDKDILLLETNLLLTTNKLDEAVANLEKAIMVDPKNTNLFLNLGILYEQSNNEEKAEANYKKVIELDPGNFDGVYSLGAFYYNKAVKVKKQVDNMDLATFRKESPQLIEKYKAMFKEALPFFEKAHQLKPDDKQTLEGLKTIYSILERKEDVEKIQAKIDKLN